MDHTAGYRAYYRLSDDWAAQPERSQFPSQDAYTHTTQHELVHPTGHPGRLNRPTLVDLGGFGSETYTSEDLRAVIAAMMTDEQLGIGHVPRQGTANVSSWIKTLKNELKEIWAAAVNAPRILDWLMARAGAELGRRGGRARAAGRPGSGAARPGTTAACRSGSER